MPASEKARSSRMEMISQVEPIF